MIWGSPGAGKPHAGKYRELPLLRQRGGGGQVLSLTSVLPTQNSDTARPHTNRKNRTLASLGYDNH